MAASTHLHSNAFNFMSFINGGVDPRTGLYTVSIALPELKTDDLAGPVVALALAFSPLNTQDTGYGLGWNLQLTQYSPDSRILSLSTGETFKVTETAADGQMLMKEKKLDSFHAHDLGNDRYRIVHKSGLVEILELQGAVDQAVALPVEIHSADGRTATLTYGDYYLGHPLLTEVRDAQRRLLTLVRASSSVEVVLHPDQVAAPFVMTLDGADNRVSRITLPTDEQAGWRLNYEQLGGLLCITEVWTPTGAHETVLYDDPGHAFPLSAQRPNLRRVTAHVTDPAPYHGFNPDPGPDPEPRQPSIDVRYSYGATGVSNTHNFLGHDASGLIWEDDGLDNLYRIVGSYLYATTEILHVAGQTVRSTERTFNRFHLLTEQRVTQRRNVKKTVTAYHADDDLDFDQQPTNFQLPATVTDTWYSLDNPNLNRNETVRSDYDRWGNLTEQVQANGVAETSTWYPAAGELDGAVVLCPPDPHGFVRQIKSRTVTPVAREPQDPLNPDDLAPVLLTRYRYQALKPVSGSGTPWLVLNDERLLQRDGAAAERLLQTTAHQYIDAPEDSLRHGRPHQQQVTLNGHDTLTAYAYEKTTGRAGETVLVTTQTLSSSLDAETKVITLEHSLLNGEPLLTRDDTDVEIRYVYDALGRVLSETVAPGTDYVATRNYAYQLVANNGEQAWQEATDVKGVTVRSHLDGLSRVVSEQRQDTEAVGQPLRRTYRAQYDARGQLTSETEYDWLPDKPDLVLTRHFGYDDWGQPMSETGPDGVVSFEQTDQVSSPLGPVKTEWQQTGAGSTEKWGLTITQLNLFEQPASVERFARDGTSLGRQFIEYDGLGRILKQINPLTHTTGYRYDVFDRTVKTILPDQTLVERTYATHSSEDLPVSISVDAVVLGEQSFDSLERRTRSVTGGREQFLTYAPGQTQPSEVKTASGQTIEYQYIPALGEDPLLRRIKDTTVSASYTYDLLNARLEHCQEQDQQLSREYYSTGELKSETRTQGIDVYDMHYSYSLQGRLIAYTDVLNQIQTCDYDSAGRLRQTALGQTLSTFTYDELSQVKQIKTVDGEQQVTIDLEYDDAGRESTRTFNLDGVIQVMTQVFDSTDQLKQRTLKQGTTVLRDETYTYDPRGRLTRYVCADTSTQPPVDPYGHAIKSQLFRFDEYDNLILVGTTFDGGSNNATYHYEGDDPAQLTRITNNKPELGYPAEIVLTYDADGNLIQDEEGRTLTYDALGRLLEVSGSSSGSRYRYDPLDKLSAEEGGDALEQRFYRDEELTTRLSGTRHSAYLRGGDYLLAERTATRTRLLAGDPNNTVLNQIDNGAATASRYTVYGHRDAAPRTGEVGYNGELAEADTGWQLLGNGYRAYNPVLMRFHGPDNLSPFEEGGVNAYAYCAGDPVNLVDPSGHAGGFILRLFRNVKTTAVVQLPSRLGLNTAGSAARLSKIKPRLVTDLESLQSYQSASVKQLGLKMDIALGKSFSKYSQLSARKAVELKSLNEVTQALDYARSSVGRQGVTKEAVRKIRSDVKNFKAQAENMKSMRYQAYKRELAEAAVLRGKEGRKPGELRNFLGISET